MRKDNFSHGAAGPVRPGRGEGELAAQARHYTAAALQTLDGLLKSEDEKTRFAAAKYLLEAGWGRPAPTRPSDDGAQLEPELQERLFALLDRAREVKLEGTTRLPKLAHDGADVR